MLLNVSGEEDKIYLTELYRQNERKLFNLAYSVLQHREDAEDCVSDVFVIVIRYLKTLRDWPEQRQKAFLYTCCKNRAISIYRKKRKVLTNERQMPDEDRNEKEDLPDVYTDVVREVNGQMMCDAIFNEINRMKPIYRDLLMMKISFGMKNADIAKVMGISENLVSKRIERARDRLSRFLEDNYNGR